MVCNHQSSGICGICLQSQQNYSQQNMANQSQLQNAQALNQQYQGMAVQSMQGNMILGQLGASFPRDEDYDMFRKYAHLEDGELIRLFYDEQLTSFKVAEELARQIVANAETKKLESEKKFFAWCAKYKRHLTKERIDKLKPFL